MPLPQRIAALPRHIGSGDNTAFQDAAPGHRFQMYLRYWQGLGGTSFAAYKNVKVDKSLPKDQKKAEEKQLARENANVLKEVCPLGPSAQATLQGLRQRQQALIANHGDNGLTFPATSTAPFATGLGNEHPIENGFAFLTPYGLPYLAGSGVKGVLRRAAEELALFADEYAPLPHPDPLPEGEGETQLPSPAGGRGAGGEGMTLLDVWWLFGFEGAQSKQGPAAALFDRSSASGRAFEQSLPSLAARDDLYDFIRMALADDRKNRAYYLDQQEDRRLAFLSRLLSDNTFRQSIHTRGALDFWDVFPAPAGDRLVVEIMTPHHAGYYMQGLPPHDAESPVPVPFLAVPAQSAFDFHAVCAANRLPKALRTTWQPKLRTLFAHAFDWLGFGAKTAVGYGAMRDGQAPCSTRLKGSDSTATVPQADPQEEEWPGARIKFNHTNKSLIAEKGGKVAIALAPNGEELLASLPDEMSKKVKANQFVKLTAHVAGNALLGIDA